jgi:hypothetical protein
MLGGSDQLIDHRIARLTDAWNSNRVCLAAGLVLLLAATSGCSTSIYGWTVRTSSTLPAESFRPTVLEREPVAIFEAHAPGGLRGNELGLAYYLADILGKVAPNIKVVSPQDTATRINREGLAPEYVRMRTDYEQTNMLEAGALRKLGAAIGARYVFQPRLGSFVQTMTERWKPVDLRIVQTRSSILRLSLQLWDTHTGAPVWGSTAEAILSAETVTQDPVFLEDAAKVALGSVVTDLLSGKTASTYTPLSEFLDLLIRRPPPEEKN